jgi:hypothetical protein
MYLDLLKLFRVVSTQLSSMVGDILLSDNICNIDDFDIEYLSLDQLVYLFNDDFKKNNIINEFTIVKEDENIKLNVNTNNKVTWFKNNNKLYLFFVMELILKKQYYGYIQLYDMLYRFGLHPKMFNPYNTQNHSYILYNINDINIDDFKLLSLDFFDSYNKKKITKFII